MTQYRTTEAYISGAICGHMWMPAAMAGKPIRKDMRGHWGFFDKGDSFRDALLSLLTREGGDFQDSAFSADSELVIIRRAYDGNGKYRLHVRTRPIGDLHDCADLINQDAYSSDFFGDNEL